MRLCLYTETALPKIGGQELVVDALAREFTAAGHEVAVLAQHPRRPLKPADERLPYRVVRHPRFVSTWRLVRYYRHCLARLRKDFAFDVLHCHSVHPCGYLGSLCCPRWNVPLVLTSHGADLREHGNRLAKPGSLERSRQAVAAADALVSISRFTTAGFLRLCPQPRRLVQIPNGVDVASLSRPVPRPDLPAAIRSGQYVLFLGRLHPYKGVDVLLQAMVLIKQQADVRLVVAGDGDGREGLELLATSLGIGGRVSFVGSVSGATKHWLLQQALCVAVPSRMEAGPLVILEAYAAGKPVVGSRIPGIEELISEGRTGRLVEPEQPAALAAALNELLQNPAMAAGWGAASRLLADDYAWPAIAARHIALYQELAARKAASKAA
jgi:glycosyltransferase involved in cell wall biosynthesis